MARYAISQPVTQVEAPRLLKGKGRYTSDVFLDRLCHAYFLRSPHAHADIVRIDTTAAKAMPGMPLIWPECANNEASFFDYLVRARGNLEAIANPGNEE